MNRLYQVCLLCFVCIVVFVLIDYGEASNSNHHRQRRYLTFRNNTKFFLRLNFKANMVPWTQIFAQAVGFRLNYEEPPETQHPFQHLRVYRSTMFKHLEVLFDRNGFSGFHCIRRAICEMRITTQPKGIYHRILKIIFRKSPATENWFNFASEDCPTYTSQCLLSILHVSQYTDL